MNRRHSRGIGLWAMACVAAALAVAGCGGDQPPAEEQPSALLAGGEPVFVRHVLIQYAGATGARPEAARSRAQADSLCRALRARAASQEDFAALAKQFSDDASAEDGGKIAALRPGDTPPAFEHVAVSLRPGELSEVFETNFGFHFMQRLDTTACTTQHILIAYQGAEGAAAAVTRSRVEALDRAQRILAEVRNPNVSFSVAARNYSDDVATSHKGGAVGNFTRDNARMPVAFVDAAFALQPDQISEIVETPAGFHIIRRVEDRSIRVCHVLVSYATGNLGESQRTREQAMERALDVLYRARQGEDFAALALEYSDDSRTKENGGRLPPLRIGTTVPEFEDAAFRLTPGQVSDVVETEFGFHVIRRVY